MKKPSTITAKLKDVINDGKRIKFKRTSDLVSYKEFISFFEKLKIITEHDLIIGINFTYGWMPTIFEFTSNEIKSATAILNKVKTDTLLTSAELTTLRNLFNNSLVGTSKLLHFINPKVYAIWDSRVYHYLTKMTAYDYKLKNVDSYLEYLNWIKTVIADENFKDLKKEIINKVGYNISDYRTVEIILYSFGQKAI